MKRAIPNLVETVQVRLMPGQRARIEQLIRENPERWTLESEFVRGAVNNFIILFEQKRSKHGRQEENKVSIPPQRKKVSGVITDQEATPSSIL